jgi:hypothetical protein
MLFQEYGVNQKVLDFKIDKSELEQKLTVFTQCLTDQKEQYLKHSTCVKETTRHMWQQVFSTLKV